MDIPTCSQPYHLTIPPLSNYHHAPIEPSPHPHPLSLWSSYQPHSQTLTLILPTDHLPTWLSHHTTDMPTLCQHPPSTKTCLNKDPGPHGRRIGSDHNPLKDKHRDTSKKAKTKKIRAPLTHCPAIDSPGKSHVKPQRHKKP